MSESIEVRVPGGYISARIINNPEECPGIKTIFLPDNPDDYFASYPSVKMEKSEDGKLRALVWNNTEKTLHSDEIIFKEPEPKKDIFAERIAKIRAKAERDKEEKQKLSKTARIDSEKQKIKELKERIQTLIKLANECLEVGLDMNFQYNGNINFFIKSDDRKYIEYLVLYGKISDFYTNGDSMFIVEKYTDKMYGITHHKYVENFLAEFDAFETAFYEWIDGLDDCDENSSKSKYETFEELYVAYGLDNPNKSRGDLTREENQAYIQDCFDLYEKIGFSETFHASKRANQKHKRYDGLKFEVFSRISGLANMPMWNIKMENGDIISAEPEEICLAEMDNDCEQTSKEKNQR